METALFWVAWGFISFWALKTFYFSYDKDKLRKLRLTASGIDLSVLILFFLPWLPPVLGKTTGWNLIAKGNVFVTLLGILIVGSVVALFTNDKTLHKFGAVSHITASIFFILTMIKLMPETYTLKFQFIAPIIASMMLLVGNVVVLLLWQQIQLLNKKKRS